MRYNISLYLLLIFRLYKSTFIFRMRKNHSSILRVVIRNQKTNRQAILHQRFTLFERTRLAKEPFSGKRTVPFTPFFCRGFGWFGFRSAHFICETRIFKSAVRKPLHPIKNHSLRKKRFLKKHAL